MNYCRTVPDFPAVRWISGALLSVFAASLAMGEGQPQLLLRINLGGPAIAGEVEWEAGPERLGQEMSRFENQAVFPVPEAPGELAAVIRSSLWNSEGRNRLCVGGLPAGELTVFLDVWEDSDPQIWTAAVNGRVVLANHPSGSSGSWQRLGPWAAAAKEGGIELTSEGGHANWSGLEIWSGIPMRSRPRRP